MRTLGQLLSKPGRIIGTWSQIAHGDVIDALGIAGYDFTIVDCEHGAFGIETAAELIRCCEAAGLVPLVRVPRGDDTAIGKALDAGAGGVLAPAVESAADAAALVAATRFAPHGTRGACPIVRAAAHSAMAWRAFVSAQAECGIVAMIETTAGLHACEAICAVPGLQALLIGPFDLAVSMGLEGAHRHPDVVASVHRLIDTARNANLPVIMPVFAGAPDALGAEIAAWAQCGIRIFAVGADKIMLAHALRSYRTAAADAT